MKINNFVRGICIVALLLVLAMSLSIVQALPTGPGNITRDSDSRFNVSTYNTTVVWAQAGNVTKLTIDSLSQTQSWQGYYGDITGTITLDDAEGYTLYDWYAAEPQGEVYAATDVVNDWSTAHCFNYTNNGTYSSYAYDSGKYYTTTTNVLNLTELENSLGIGMEDYDGVDKTFNVSGTIVINKDWGTGALTYENHKEFFVGTVNITSGSCPATNTFESHCTNKTQSDPTTWAWVDKSYCSGATPEYEWDGSIVGNNFQEVLLTVNNSETLIYTTIIENDLTNNLTDVFGYNNATWDFQMLVAEDGSPSGADTATPFYFYVELE